ncbi:MAG TPA: arginine--tRNA ligase [Candidatus Dormibacteraeota bacterium]|nr:arginine--tRNA ligase [Candidatus Dormibacteraeota bacterium]
MEPLAAERGILPDDALRSFAQALRESAAALYGDARIEVAFEAPRRPEFGEFATNAAFSLVRTAHASPQDVAKRLTSELAERAPRVAALFASIEPVGGFINLRLAPQIWQTAVAAVLRDGENFGRASHRGERISLEFGSANPTGPLLVVQGRALSIGDTLARTLRLRGYDVFVEWIINDAGGQLETLGRSLDARYRQLKDPAYPFPEDGYPGEYLVEIAQRLRDDGADVESMAQERRLEFMARFARDAIVAEQRQTADRFGVDYDLWQSERELHERGRIRAGIERLTELGLTYEADGAIFFRATQFGDDKDRVLVRADGRPTYFCTDVAYHYEKLRRADRVIDVLGPDHHGYIGRLAGLATALGYPGRLEVLIAQQVTLVRGGEHVAMSKRAGQIVTLDEVLDEVGLDATRFFFAMLATDSPLTFDLKLAVEQSNDNPVFYVQYGHARICSVLRKADADDVEAARNAALRSLVLPAELALARRLSELPHLAQSVVDQLAPHRLARYARDVATDFHQFYTECRILGEEPELRRARLALALAAQRVLAMVLGLLGVTAPESM